MSYGFDAAPKVVKMNKDEGVQDDEERLALNIMYDKRIFRGNTHSNNQPLDPFE